LKNKPMAGTRRGGAGESGTNRKDTPRVLITRRLHFSAAHRLGREDWPDSRNRDVFGLCSNPNWHGHNYEIDVTVEGPIDPETGYVLDLKTLRDLVESRVIRDLDHRNLNLDVRWLQGVNPTTENLVVAIWNRLADAMPHGTRLARIVLHETPRNRVEYAGEMETR
jgi:6-pyruvoyltetrahydropterin/6-carboxytetrahydropterin synthase